jgi:ketosteroid isomerase-like protein
MSANLDLVRSLYVAWERGDYFSSAEWAHPEIEFVLADGPTPFTQTGLTSMVEAWRAFLDTWEDHRTEVQEYRELDDERVLVLVYVSARGKASGLEVGRMPRKMANLFHIRGAKIVRLVMYFDCERAFADLGLDPEASAVDRD